MIIRTINRVQKVKINNGKTNWASRMLLGLSLYNGKMIREINKGNRKNIQYAENIFFLERKTYLKNSNHL